MNPEVFRNTKVTEQYGMQHCGGNEYVCGIRGGGADDYLCAYQLTFHTNNQAEHESILKELQKQYERDVQVRTYIPKIIVRYPIAAFTEQIKLIKAANAKTEEKFNKHIQALQVLGCNVKKVSAPNYIKIPDTYTQPVEESDYHRSWISIAFHEKTEFYRFAMENKLFPAQLSGR